MSDHPHTGTEEFPTSEGMVSPFIGELGFEYEEETPGRVRASMPFREELIGDTRTRVIHGGVITSLIDSCSGYAVHSACPQPQVIATLDLRIDYMKPAEPEREIQCRAHCYKVTKNVAFTRAIAFQADEDDLVATSVGTFMLGTRARYAEDKS